MLKGELNQHIVLKKYINEKGYEKINDLKELSEGEDGINLKFELEYKLQVLKNQGETLKEVNEFLYYADDCLVGYLGISCFGGNIGEINGAVHPEWRRRGIFKKLFELASDECRRRGFAKTLLLCDDKSSTAVEFIKSTGAAYSFSEYRMECSRVSGSPRGVISLRKATNSDVEEISKQNGIFFGIEHSEAALPEEEEKNNRITYMVELEGTVIGKIRVGIEENSAYIGGFGILPEFRGKGYGREALMSALHMQNENGVFHIELDVVCDNSRALNLYKSCGFEEVSKMNYYEAII